MADRKHGAKLPPGPGAPPPCTVPPRMAAKEDILRRARAAAHSHMTEGDVPKQLRISTNWQDFFSERKAVEVPQCGCTFNVYLAGTSGPIIYCLHGGGYTGLSFAFLAEELKDECRVAAIDLRHHGLTVEHTADAAAAGAAQELDFSSATLCADVAAVWEALYGGQEENHTIIVGHSVGGALATTIAREALIPGLEGLVVIDVVEGTALAALPGMTTLLGRRPTSFPGPAAAMEWAIETAMCRSRASASISLLSQLREEGDELVWRTPLLASEPYWRGWYEGLSEAFLAVTVPKVLVLAGSDRMDKAMTIAQMQGKFQMVLVPGAGHAVHEDEPWEVAGALRTFIKRFRVGLPPLEIPRRLPTADGA